MEKNEKEDQLDRANQFKGYNIKRIADALEQIAKNTKQLNWNMGFLVEMKKRENPVISDEIVKEWEEKANKP